MTLRTIPSTLRGGLRTGSRHWLPGSTPWRCQSCRNQLPRRASSTSPEIEADKPFYITSPIFYVNAAPHVGHLYTMVLTDVLKRWQVLKGRKAILCTGTDEHGMKVQQAAAVANMPPKEFCDLTAGTFKHLAECIGLSNDHFVRTTDETHKDAVQYAWHILNARGYIYQSKHEGWYCVSDETFYPESSIEKRLDPNTGKTFMASQETGKEVQWTSESNYHFRLSAFKDRLLEFYKENPKFVVPNTRMKDVVNAVSAGLQDLSVSRPVERLSWGIRVPNDERQTIYVWLDALINYITKAGYPWAPGKESEGGWPADVQVVGKDIVRFHCIYWPAFLMALDLPPPKQILAHAHWTLGNQKMAKSTGNVVNPFLAMDRFGVDVIRYYLAHDGGIINDSDYANRFIVERYKKSLQGGLGNLASRIMRPKIWNVRKVVEAARDGTLRRTGALTRDHVGMLSNLSTIANTKIEELDPGGALQAIIQGIHQTNWYLQINAPWELAKTQDSGLPPGEQLKRAESNQLRIERTVYHCAEALRICGILLQPYMPTKAAELLDMIGVHESRRTFQDAQFGADFDYGVPIVPMGKGVWGSLFPPLPVED
ncbi:tRNA synthetases class I (M)-domain-containing protein [Amylocarpus encephaloides]|uniref:Probable methionine--tRNA ligase, mitochondrial n=1 Tax=Amylocarpus encephaloides TaxID=45428 RepID=A0A9P7YTS0_9HELO|nr:tRNA synthetases class I (M)-domain-containing protein [Amylocarpus encephaloides]